MNLPSLARRCVGPVVSAGLLAVVAMTSSAPAQSLGDVAKQEQARRKTSQTGKVYTNGDLRGAPQPATTTPSTPAPSTGGNASTGARPAAGADAKSDAKSDTKSDGKAGGDAKTGGTADKPAPAADATQDEATWRQRQTTLQDALSRARTFAEALQSRINGLSAEFTAKDDPSQRALVANERQKALTELDRVKKEIQQHTDALADLQEEARRAGVPAGWLR